MNVKKIITVILSISLFAAPLTACSTKNESTQKKTETEVQTIDLKENKAEKAENKKLAKKIGLEDVKNASIKFQGYTNIDEGKKDKDKPTSIYSIYGTDLDVDNITVINQILSYVENAKDVTENEQENITDYVENVIKDINFDLKLIKEGKKLPNTSNAVNTPFKDSFNRVKTQNPDKYDPNITFKSSDGKSVKVPLLIDSINNLVKVDGKTKKLGDEAANYIFHLLDRENIDTVFSKDVYELAKKHNIELSFREDDVSVKLPKTLNVPTFGKGYKLYWAYVNDLIKKSDEFKYGIEKNLGQNVTVEKYYIPNVSFAIPSYFKYMSDMNEFYSSAHLVALRNGKKLIGAYIEPLENERYGLLSLDKKNFEQVVNMTYPQWYGEKLEKDYDRNSLSKLNPEDFIRKYYKMLDKNNQNADKLILQFPSSVAGEIEKYEGQNTQESVKNIEYAKVENIKKSNILQDKENDLTYMVDVNMKFRKEIAQPSGKDTLIIDLIKIGGDSGYRILTIGR